MTGERARAAVLLGWLVLTLIVMASGSGASPILALMALGIILTSLRFGLRFAFLAGLGALTIIVLRDTIAAGLSLASFLAVAATAATGVVASILVHRRRLPRQILHPASGAEPPSDRRRLDPDGWRRPDLEEALAESCTRTGAVRATLWEVDEAAGVVRQTAASDHQVWQDAIPLAGSTLGWAWQEGMPMRLDREVWLAADRRAQVVRLASDEGRGPLVSWEWPAGGSPAEADTTVLRGATDHLERVMTLADARAAALAEQRRSALLIGTLQRLPSRIDPDEVARELVTGACDMVSATGGALAVWMEEQGRVLAVDGADGGPMPGATFEVTASEFALAGRSGALIVREYGLAGPGLPIVAPAERWHARPRCVAAVPLLSGDHVVAVLGVWSSERPTLDPVALSLVQTLAPFAALQLGHALEYGRVRERAETDPLTGLRNRRAFEQALQAESTRYDRYGHSIGLILLDVDHFKQINDRWGHDAGDEVLRAVSVLLRREVRDIDVAARIGGEEFVVLLPETSLVAAREVADRLRVSIETARVPWKAEQLPLRASLGVTACPSCVTSPGELMASADAALYTAKRGGRNRVVSAPMRS